MLRRLHRMTAIALGLFLVLHLGNHALLLAGTGVHRTTIQALRPLYRNAVIEPLLIAALVVQAGLGLALIWRRGRPQGGWAWAQVISGIALILFLVQHVPAVLLARPETDTDTAFAAAVVTSWPGVLYFAPYYTLALTALATHLAAALRFARWPAPAPLWVRALPWVGLAFGLAVVAGLRGTFG